jgi:hypothetical protein
LAVNCGLCLKIDLKMTEVQALATSYPQTLDSLWPLEQMVHSCRIS